MARQISALPFEFSSKIYKSLYKEKDATSEIDFVRDSCGSVHLSPNAKVLDIGCGLGRHSIELALQGCDVIAIDTSQEMIKLARAEHSIYTNIKLSFECCDVSGLLSKDFDSIIALFHVVSYITTDYSLTKFFTSCRNLLKPGGHLLFDVWYSPAVFYQKPQSNCKVLEVEHIGRVIRKCTPTEFPNDSLVDVNYDYHYCMDNEETIYTEVHRMRHFTTNEIRTLAKLANFEVISSQEFMTGATPSRDTWGVLYSLIAV
jgi:cyclopropane fatty-acyl-phospholipid synthase-like methyltransferase